MKRYKAFAILAISSLGLTSCGVAGGALGTIGQSVVSDMITSQTQGNTTQNTTTTQSGTGLLGNLLSAFIGGGQVTAADVVGTWKYQGSACVFESENLLARVGGVVAANKLEQQMDTKLANFGIKPGISTFTFNKDQTYSAVIGSREITGQYQIDPKTNKITMTYLAGLAQLNATVSMSGRNLTLLFEADKLLALTSGLSKLTGNGGSDSSLSSLLSNYNGMQIGLKLVK